MPWNGSGAREICGACFAVKTNVIEEWAADQAAALGRYGQLSAQARDPALCQKQDGTYRVCHVDRSFSGRTG